MSILVIAEHNHQSLKESTLHTLTAATQLGGDVEVLVAGNQCQAVASHVATIPGVTKVLHAEHEAYSHFLADSLANLVHSIASNYSHILAPSTTFGKDFLPRVAALNDVAQISDVMEIISVDTFKRPIFAGNAIATVQSSDALKVMTIRTTTFDKCEVGGGSAAVETLAPADISQKSSYVSQELTSSDHPELTSAAIVVSGGRGLGSKENFQVLEQFADKLGAAVGASRAAVDAGYVPNDYQVGQTGKVVAPELYIAVGISGAIQHLAGMKDSKVIVAINKDENAPIFEIADYGIVADLFDVIPEMEKLL